jgi:hypothetical protein
MESGILGTVLGLVCVASMCGCIVGILLSGFLSFWVPLYDYNHIFLNIFCCVSEKAFGYWFFTIFSMVYKTDDIFKRILKP